MIILYPIDLRIIFNISLLSIYSWLRPCLIRQQGGEKKEDWLVNKIRQVKQFSELLGGPKWKNFIRLFSMHGINKKRRVQFQYNLQNYALNFDDGINGEVEGDAYLDFMLRYVAPLGITKGEASHE